MQVGDLVFVRGRSLISRLVLFFDKGKWSHVAVAVSDTEITEAQYFTKVRRANINKYIEYEVVPMNLTPEEQVKLLAIATALEGSWYDYKQVAYYVLRNIFKLNKEPMWNNPNALICSEYVYVLFTAIDRIYGDAFVTPNELYEILEKEDRSILRFVRRN